MRMRGQRNLMDKMTLAEYWRRIGQPKREAFGSVSKAELQNLLAGKAPPPAAKKKAISTEQAFALLLQAHDVTGFVQEHKFAKDAEPPRQFRFDFAFPDRLMAGNWRLAVEIEGITDQGGRHQRMDGFAIDLEKYELALELGWVVYRITPKMARSLRSIEMIRSLLGE